MYSLALFATLLTGSLTLALYRRELGNDTLQQQENEAGFYSRITNGLTAARTQFRYQVGLLIVYPHGDAQRCGGSLISNEWVLTAAHCTLDASSVFVYIGTKKFDHRQFMFKIFRNDIKEHDDYNKTTYHHDIGVIRIPPVQFSDTIGSVRLPSHSSRMTEYDGIFTVLAGWGRTSDSSTDYAYDLKYFAFHTIKNDKCAETYGTPYIYDGKICTATPGKIGGCHGDSGSPLVLANDDLQIGIFVFHHIQGCESGQPNAFTRVSFYLDWIKRETGLEV